MSNLDDTVVIHEYSLQQALADGTLVEVCKHRWNALSAGKPIVATVHLATEVSLAYRRKSGSSQPSWMGKKSG